VRTRGHPRLALPHGEVELDPDDVVLLRDAAAALAGRSIVARDLSLLLDRALTDDRPVVLRRSELNTLARLAASNGVNRVAIVLADVA
jgi:hypothetical protein